MGVRPVASKCTAGRARPEHDTGGQPGESGLASCIVQLQKPELAVDVAAGLWQSWGDTKRHKQLMPYTAADVVS